MRRIATLPRLVSSRSKRAHVWLLVAWAGAIAAGCSRASEPADRGGAAGDAAPSPSSASSGSSTSSSTSGAPVTFARDIAPIVYQRCASCHRPGDAAPFSLLSYDDVKRRAQLIADVTGRRVMPPWLPVEDHGAFAAERRLSDREIDVFRRWHEQGTPEGDASQLPAPPTFVEGWQLGQPDLIVSLPKPYRLRPDGSDVWRNFVMRVPVSETRFVRAVELRPGSARFVHHAIMGLDNTRSSSRRDAQDADPGFEGMELGDAQPPDGHLVGWTPGMVPVPAPEGSSWQVAPGSDLVLQLHLTPSGKAEDVQPQVGLYFARTPPAGAPMFLLRLDADHLLDIPAGEREFVVTDRFQLPVDVRVHAIYPHAHFLGRKMDARATLPDGREQSLIRIDDWNFKWQDVYRYNTPLRLPKGTVLSFRYTFDNSAENPRNPSKPPKRVGAGMRSSDEMAHLQLQVQPDRADDIHALRLAMYQEMVRKTPGDAWVHYELGNLLRESGRTAEATGSFRTATAIDAHHAAAQTNLGVLLQESGALVEAIARYRDALRAEPDFASAHFNLANALRTQGQLAEAMSHYERTIALEPSMGQAHNNLGELLAAQGRMPDALRRFERAVALNPSSATAHANVGAALGAIGRVQEAVAHFRRALEIDPQHEAARRNLELVGLPAGPVGREAR